MWRLIACPLVAFAFVGWAAILVWGVLLRFVISFPFCAWGIGLGWGFVRRPWLWVLGVCFNFGAGFFILVAFVLIGFFDVWFRLVRYNWPPVHGRGAVAAPPVGLRVCFGQMFVGGFGGLFLVFYHFGPFLFVSVLRVGFLILLCFALSVFPFGVVLFVSLAFVSACAAVSSVFAVVFGVVLVGLAWPWVPPVGVWVVLVVFVVLLRCCFVRVFE
ncbi:hypothetical protein SAMN04488032_103262 [Pacificibacter marinus]|nr:hypothetical protein SAMN04488032_103262 [Pacificibacter marinus]